MNRTMMVRLSMLLIPIAIALMVPGTALAQPDVQTDITVKDDGTCDAYDVQCRGGRCNNNQQVWWEVTNENDKTADVAIVNLKHRGTGFYVDPLIGPGNDGIHRVSDIETNDSKILRTRVRQVKDPFVGQYEYEVSVSLGGGDWTICKDPMIDIGD